MDLDIFEVEPFSLQHFALCKRNNLSVLTSISNSDHHESIHKRGRDLSASSIHKKDEKEERQSDYAEVTLVDRTHDSIRISSSFSAYSARTYPRLYILSRARLGVWQNSRKCQRHGSRSVCKCTDTGRPVYLRELLIACDLSYFILLFSLLLCFYLEHVFRRLPT